MTTTSGSAILTFVRSHPNKSWEFIADQVGLDYRTARMLIEELYRRGYLSGERENIHVTGDAIPDGFQVDLGAVTRSPGSPVVVDELERTMEEFRRNIARLDEKIRALANRPIRDLIAEYREKLGGWITMHQGRSTAMNDTVRTLEEDVDFMTEGKGLVRIQDGIPPVPADNLLELRSMYVAAHANEIPVTLNTPLIPVPFTLSMVQRAAVFQASGAVPTRILKDPDVPAAIQQKHLRAIEELPAFLGLSDKIRVRYSESKTDLYQYCGGLMQEYAPKVMLMGESILPPDMYYTDMRLEHRRRVHLHCMKEAVSLADSSKIFDCPLAQSTRTTSQRHRKTSVWTRLVMGLTLDDPTMYIRLTMRNYDELIFARLSGDRAISPLLTLDAYHAYLGKIERKDAEVYFEDPVTKGNSFNAYERLLRRLQTTVMFVNYKGRGLRLRFFSSPLSSTEEQDWASRLAQVAYRNALETSEAGLAYVSGVESAVESAKAQFAEMANAVVARLTAGVAVTK